MKFLAISNAHHLAHVSRLLEISKVLRAKGHEVLFAGHGQFLEVAKWDGFAIRDLPYVPAERAAELGRSEKIWKWFRNVDLEGFVEAELGLYDEFRPDLVLIDNRVTARASAEKAGLPSAAVLNVHMSNYRRFPYYGFTDLIGTDRIPGVKLIDDLENGIECYFWDRLVMPDMNRLRRKLGLKRRYAYAHEEGDLSLFADVPEFNPVRRLPGHARYIGPLTWHNHFPAPACLELLDRNRPTVYLSIGSVGLDDDFVEQLARHATDVQFVVAKGGDADRPPALPDNVFVEGYVNTDLLLPHCSLVCCHGGNGTLYQALNFGLPAVVVATHDEQNYGGKRIQWLGLGKSLTQKQLSSQGPDLLFKALREVLDDPVFRDNAQRFSGYIKQWDSAELAAAEIQQLINRR